MYACRSTRPHDRACTGTAHDGAQLPEADARLESPSRWHRPGHVRRHRAAAAHRRVHVAGSCGQARLACGCATAARGAGRLRDRARGYSTSRDAAAKAPSATNRLLLAGRRLPVPPDRDEHAPGAVYRRRSSAVRHGGLLLARPRAPLPAVAAPHATRDRRSRAAHRGVFTTAPSSRSQGLRRHPQGDERSWGMGR